MVVDEDSSNLARSAKEAASLGQNLYFTGRPCKHGHVSARSVHNNCCVSCMKVARKKYYKKNMNSIREDARIRSGSKKYRDRRKKRRLDPAYRARENELAKLRRNPSYSPKKQSFSIPKELTGKERKRVYAKLYYHANKEKIFKQAKRDERAKKRAEYIRVWTAEYGKTKRGRAISFMRKCIYRCLANKTDRTEKILGYTRDELISHIEKQFVRGMSWDNHGEWHIDHKKPIKAMLDMGITCPKKINALENLQPLWAKENLIKGSKMERSI